MTMVAEIGGYLGLLLGISVVQIAKGLVARKKKKRSKGRDRHET